MPRQPNPYTRVSVYQVEGQLDPQDVLRSTYLDRHEFSIEQVEVGGRTGFFVGGAVETAQAKWASVVDRWVNGSDLALTLGNTTAAGVLLIPTAKAGSGTVWALCFGMGFHLLDSTRVVPDLGRRLAARCIDPDRLRSITHSRLDSRAFVARTSIPGGDNIGGFGASELGDLISRIVGPATIEGIIATDSEQSVEIRGADSANIPLARDPNRLVSDLDAIEVLLDQEPIPELATIEQLRALKSSNPIRAALDRALDDALGEDDPTHLGLSWPTELADEAAPLSYFLVTGLPSGESERGSELNSLLDQVKTLPTTQRIARLDRMRVQAFSDDDEAISSLLPARRWLSFETNHDGHRYCMHDGRWYMVDDGLDALLTERLEQVFRVAPPFAELPPWPRSMEEDEYNALVAQALGGVLLDKRLVQCKVSARGFESCDVLTPDGTYVHIKMVGRSTGASHLFAQAGVSAQALIEDSSARTRLLDVVGAAGGDPAWVPLRPERAVLVMGNNSRVIDAASLFSFSRMRLARLNDECRTLGVELSLFPVQRA